jgi:hypothetical protein
MRAYNPQQAQLMLVVDQVKAPCKAKWILVDGQLVCKWVSDKKS